MKRRRDFINGVSENNDGTLTITTLSTTGETLVTTVPKLYPNCRVLLGCSVNFAFTEEGEATRTAHTLSIEPNVRAYFPTSELGFYEQVPVNLDKITNQHTVLKVQATQLPPPFNRAGVVLPTGHVIGFQSGTDLKELTNQELLFTLGEESETQAIVESLPDIWWIKGIRETDQVEVHLWNGSEERVVAVIGVGQLCDNLGVEQVTADLIGEACTEELQLFPNHRRGVPAPFFHVETLYLNPNTLWHFARVQRGDKTVRLGNEIWTLKEPVAPDITTLVVTPSDLIL